MAENGPDTPATTAEISDDADNSVTRVSSHPGNQAWAAPELPSAEAAVATKHGSAELRRLEMSEAETALLGTTLGNFRIVKHLGRGGMGTVFLGEHLVIGSKVAIKFLHRHLASDKVLVERFFAEARATNLIGHENIVSIFDLSLLPPDRYYLVMEYLDGKPLAAMTDKPVDEQVAVPILMQACDALQAAHACGVIHRDLKPENVFLIRRGSTEHFVKLVDFGIAKLGSTPSGVTAAGLVVGTPEYMAPEQWTGEPIDGRVDLYALGVIAYLLATGKLPFCEKAAFAYCEAHRKKMPVSPLKLNPALTEGLARVIAKAMAKEPENRYQDAQQMRQALKETLEARATPAAPSVKEVVAKMVPAPGPGVTSPIAPAAAAADAASRPTNAVPASSASSAVPASPAPARSSKTPVALQAQVSWPGLAEPQRLDAVDISRAGAFLCAASPLPPLFSRVHIQFSHAQHAWDCDAEVVRHVSAKEASEWGMKQGFAVQFVNVTPAVKKALNDLVAGRTPPGAWSGATGQDDAAVEKIIDAHQRVANADPYVWFKLAPDVECSEIRRRSRKLMGELESLKTKSLSANQSQRLKELIERVRAAFGLIQSPMERAAYDAGSGNFRGVARCLAAGLNVDQLDKLRREFLGSHAKNETSAQLRAVAANSLANRGNEAAAIVEYENALALDPLNLSLHQAYWSMKRHMANKGKGK